MRWKRRHCYAKIAAALFVLSCVGALLILYQQSLLVRFDNHQGTEKVVNWERKQMPRMESNQSLTRPPSLLGSRTDPEATSQVLPKVFLGPDASLSEDVQAGEIQKTEPYNYIINEADKCLGRDIFLVLLIAVDPKNSEARDAIRQTWGNDSVARELGFVRLFLLGLKEGAQGLGGRLQRSIAAESQQYHDIVQQEYVDSYNNLTIKTLMGMHWVARYCQNARFVMKTDSDMFVNTEYLIHKLLKPEDKPRQKYFTGYLMRGYTPNRNKDSKWYMPPELYPDESYPTFCSGTGYVFSSDLAQLLYNVSLSIRRLHLEDVYIGICLAKLRIQPEPPPNEFLFHHWRVSYSSCKYRHLITSHQFHPSELIRYWQHLQANKHQNCSEQH